MLVLSRKLGEKIYIGDNICITVVDIDRGKIRLGIEAPRDVSIMRAELLPSNDGALDRGRHHPSQLPQETAADTKFHEAPLDDPRLTEDEFNSANGLGKGGIGDGPPEKVVGEPT